ncbi:MAG: type II secretion system protein [Patescibacteria group bacterium]|nr:type II secretion system protein [Patescibacteria group bacterium]
MKNKSKKGFTLIEMLIVVAIIGLLATVVLFAVARARKKAVATQMRAHMVEIMKGIEMSATDGVITVDVIAGGSIDSSSNTNISPTVTYVKHVPSKPNADISYVIGGSGACDTLSNPATGAGTDFNGSGISTAEYEVCSSGFANGFFKCVGGSCWCSVDGGCLTTP